MKTKKDIKIINRTVENVISVNDAELLQSLKSTLRFIKDLMDMYPNDQDFGRNLRVFLNEIYEANK